MFTSSALLILVAHSEFDGSVTFQTRWDRGRKRRGKLWSAHKTPAWNISQVDRFIGGRRQRRDWVGPSSKDSVIHKQIT